MPDLVSGAALPPALVISDLERQLIDDFREATAWQKALIPADRVRSMLAAIDRAPMCDQDHATKFAKAISAMFPSSDLHRLSSTDPRVQGWLKSAAGCFSGVPLDLAREVPRAVRRVSNSSQVPSAAQLETIIRGVVAAREVTAYRLRAMLREHAERERRAVVEAGKARLRAVADGRSPLDVMAELEGPESAAAFWAKQVRKSNLSDDPAATAPVGAPSEGNDNEW